MSIKRASTIPLLLILGTGPVAAEPVVGAGLYEVSYRLELPHLERYAMTRKKTVCIGDRKIPAVLPLPIFGDNDAFSGCAVVNRQSGQRFLSYNIVCPGRAAAKATATYRFAQGGFHGRVEIVLGAKNMTMTEVQSGRRLQSCKMAGRTSG